MTAKGQPHRAVGGLTEAGEALNHRARSRGAGDDALGELLDRAPVDESMSREEDEGTREAREQVARGEVFSAQQIKREIA
ncbi:MAG TPA: hypothetical protein VF520_01690 [Thermoleophilaceae bacterium]|jgi:hypothetical protein